MGHSFSLALALIFALAALPAAADPPMTADEFEAFAAGRTLDFANSEGVFGTEEYLPDRQVRWAGADGQCMTGYWFEASGRICYRYEGDPFQYCWKIWREGDHVLAQLFEDQPGDAPRRLTEATAPLSCRGPDVGV